MLVYIAKELIERAFDEGALEVIELQVQIADTGNVFTVLQGEIEVDDTASGGFAA